MASVGVSAIGHFAARRPQADDAIELILIVDKRVGDGLVSSGPPPNSSVPG
jgi:hypothetical protein